MVDSNLLGLFFMFGFMVGLLIHPVCVFIVVVCKALDAYSKTNKGG